MTDNKNAQQATDLQIFHFGGNEGTPFRVQLINDEPYFVGKDLCQILGFSKYRDVLASLDEDERVSIFVDTLGGKQSMTAVNESGFYHLVFKSSHPKAAEFRRKVTMEILPTLRRTGRYEVKPQPKSVRYARRGEGITVEVLSLLWLIGESLHQGDQKDIALELGVDRRTVSRVLSGKQRSSRVLRALYERARWNRENDALYLNPGVMAERLQQGLPMEAVRPLPVHKSEELPMVSIHRGGKLGNQNARKYGKTMKEIRNLKNR
ncbi:MAG: hypothetical protein J6C45_08420 [Alistipes sp.]|nr:hypothetical protein [Alistipes sp.]